MTAREIVALLLTLAETVKTIVEALQEQGILPKPGEMLEGPQQPDTDGGAPE